MLSLLIPLGLAPAAAFAAGCGDYPLSQAQQDFIENEGLEIAIPEGDVPVIQRCDATGDNVVDIHDIRAITMNRNQPAAHPDDPMDWDKNMFIDILDARGCQRACALPRCATPNEPPSPGDPMGGVIETTECFQTEDLDGDGTEDFVGTYEHTGDDVRGGGWALETVILTEDANGNVEAVTFPYTGQVSPASGELTQHVTMQPAGTVDLLPGTVQIDEPGVIGYRNGEPKVLYYIENGEVARAFYGVDD